MRYTRQLVLIFKLYFIFIKILDFSSFNLIVANICEKTHRHHLNKIYFKINLIILLCFKNIKDQVIFDQFDND
jgi:hypothetical protein